jgi:hypothetical protein
MLALLERMQGGDHHRHAYPVVEGFGEVGLAAGQLDEIGAGRDRVAGLYTGGFDFSLAGSADVDVHILL